MPKTNKPKSPAGKRPAAATRRKPNKGWVIQHADTQPDAVASQYWSGVGTQFSDNKDAAVRFFREQDAQAVEAGILVAVPTCTVPY